MPHSTDPQKAAIQVANLKQNRPENSSTHGAYSESMIRPLRERFLVELAEEFPSATERELRLLAHRFAQVELLGEYIERRGVIRHQRRGDLFPAVGQMDRLTTSIEARLDRLRDRESAKAADPHALYRQIEARYANPAD